MSEDRAANEPLDGIEHPPGALKSRGEAPAEPRALDRYHLTHLHSSGGLGRVWLATDPTIGREVAIKELLSDQARHPESRARFLREAQITGQLEHPNIVPVYEVGESSDGGAPFYAMRFVRGITLREAIRKEFDDGGQGRWPRRRRKLLLALAAISNAIGHAHSRGIVHRDLKPENIILGHFGELIVLDWGLAKRLDDEFEPQSEPQSEPQPEPQPEPQSGAQSGAGNGNAGLMKTSSGSVLGTIAYMSPEQAAGEAADKRTDIYGLGAILFEILTGRPPHGGDNALDVLRKIVEGETPSAHSVDSHISKGLEAICAKAMSKRPEDRYGNAKEVVEDLERWLGDEAVAALPDSPLRGLARWVRRHQGLAYTGALALMVVVVISTLAAVWLNAAAGRERGLRERSMRSSAELAALSVGREIDLRWYVLENSAADEDLRAALQSGDSKDEELRAWVGVKFAENQRRAPALSWLVMDLKGIQRARSPHADDSVGRSFAYRDYFHGQGEDFPKRSTGLAPIREAHRSVVFRSTVTGNLMVAFSVPIWDSDDEGREILGVLGMTVELGGFGFEEMQLDQTQMVVLVDTSARTDGAEGRILQHAKLVQERLDRSLSHKGSPARDTLPALRLAQLRELRAERLAHARAGRAPTAEEGQPQPASGYVTLLDSDYRDPLDGPNGGRWLAAFEPVLVKGRTGRVSDTGWVVIVQERLSTH